MNKLKLSLMYQKGLLKLTNGHELPECYLKSNSKEESK